MDITKTLAIGLKLIGSD